MSWRRWIGATVGVTAVGLATAAFVTPYRLLRHLPPGTEQTLTQPSIQPSIGILLVVYAGWMVLSRGWLSPVREELTAAPTTNAENARGQVDTANSGDATDEFVRLERISGVTPSKADALREAGYNSLRDVKDASQSELAEIVGTALTARLKADIGEFDEVEEADASAESEYDDAQSAPIDSDSSGTVSESISVLDTEIITFNSQSETRSSVESETSASPADGERTRVPESGAEGELAPTAGSQIVPIAPDKFDEFQSKPPEQPQAGSETIVGSDFDVTLQEAYYSYRQREDRFEIFEEIQTQTAESEQSEMRPEETLRMRLSGLCTTRETADDGSTDTPGATDALSENTPVRLFLNPQSSGTLSLYYRLRVWVTPEKTFKRLVEQSIETLEDVSGRGGQ